MSASMYYMYQGLSSLIEKNPKLFSRDHIREAPNSPSEQGEVLSLNYRG